MNSEYKEYHSVPLSIFLCVTSAQHSVHIEQLLSTEHGWIMKLSIGYLY